MRIIVSCPRCRNPLDIFDMDRELLDICDMNRNPPVELGVCFFCGTSITNRNRILYKGLYRNRTND